MVVSSLCTGRCLDRPIAHTFHTLHTPNPDAVCIAGGGDNGAMMSCSQAERSPVSILVCTAAHSMNYQSNSRCQLLAVLDAKL